MKIEVTDLMTGYNDQRITINLSGVLSTEERVSFNATYDKEGKLTDCSAPYSGTGCPDYYIEVAEYFKKMKELQGEKIVDVIKQLEVKINPIRDQRDKIADEYRQKTQERNALKRECDELKKKVKRFKKEDKIDEYGKKIFAVSNKIDVMDAELRTLDVELDKIFAQHREAVKMEIL